MCNDFVISCCFENTSAGDFTSAVALHQLLSLFFLKMASPHLHLPFATPTFGSQGASNYDLFKFNGHPQAFCKPLGLSLKLPAAHHRRCATSSCAPLAISSMPEVHHSPLTNSCIFVPFFSFKSLMKIVDFLSKSF